MTIEQSQGAGSAQSQLCIFNDDEWKALYPKKEYTSKTKRALKHSIHWLLALGQSDNTILPYIEKIKKGKAKALFIVDYKNYNLTPLMIATMRGRTKVVSAILDACKTNEQKLSQLRPRLLPQTCRKRSFLCPDA